MIFNLESGETVNNKFLPICKADMEERGWDELDFIVVTADAYVDHHSFGTAIISRVLEKEGWDNCTTKLEVDRRLYEIRKAKTGVLS